MSYQGGMAARMLKCYMLNLLSFKKEKNAQMLLTWLVANASYSQLAASPRAATQYPSTIRITRIPMFVRKFKPKSTWRFIGAYMKMTPGALTRPVSGCKPCVFGCALLRKHRFDELKNVKPQKAN